MNGNSNNIKNMKAKCPVFTRAECCELRVFQIHAYNFSSYLQISLSAQGDNECVKSK